MYSASYIISVEPVQEPISLSDIKKYLNVDFDDNDATITEIMTNARRYAQSATGRALAPCTIRATFTQDPPKDQGSLIAGNSLLSSGYGAVPSVWETAPACTLPLPLTPASAVTLLEYKTTRLGSWITRDQETNGNANYGLDLDVDPNELIIAPWSAIQWRATYTAGYPIGSLPSGLANALLELISYWYDNRDGSNIPESLVQQFAVQRVWRLGA